MLPASRDGRRSLVAAPRSYGGQGKAFRVHGLFSSRVLLDVCLGLVAVIPVPSSISRSRAIISRVRSSGSRLPPLPSHYP
jgi:hypothetical protein